MEKLINLKEAAEFFRMSTVNLKRLVKVGKVRSIKLEGSNRYLFRREDLEEAIQSKASLERQA